VTKKEALKVKPGAIVISIVSGTIARIIRVGQNLDMPGKPISLFESELSLGLRPESWRLATHDEIEFIYRDAIAALEDYSALV